AGADELLELFEGDVATLLRIVELAIRIALDNVRHAESLTPRVNPLKQRRRLAAILSLHFVPSLHSPEEISYAAQGTHGSRDGRFARYRSRHCSRPRPGGRRRGGELPVERAAGPRSGGTDRPPGAQSPAPPGRPVGPSRTPPHG